MKLILHALHENNLPFINNGEHVEVFEIGTGLSLSVIIGVLAITVIASLVSPKGRRMAAEAAERRRVAAGADVDATH